LAETGDVIVVAASARALVQSARAAGLTPLCVDLFADDDTVAASARSLCVPASATGLDQQAVIDALNTLDSTASVPIVYGSVVDSQFELLEQIQATRCLLGSPVSSLRKLQEPMWRADWLRRIGIAHPQTRMTVPACTKAWLSKRIDGSGGDHIQICGSDVEPDPATDVSSAGTESNYFQRHVKGRSLSITALICSGEARIIGYADQTPSVIDNTFRFAGATAIDPVTLNHRLRRSLDDCILKVASSLSLVGLVSFDFIVDDPSVDGSADTNACWLLEINARPSANFELFDHTGELFRRHLQAGIEMRERRNNEIAPHRLVDCVKTKLRRGFSVVYADRPFKMMADFKWPCWTRDRSPAGRQTGINQPLCTVHGVEETHGGLSQLLKTRQAHIESMFYQSSNKHGVRSDRGNVA